MNAFLTRAGCALFTVCIFLAGHFSKAQPKQRYSDLVNVFLGSSGDHGQLSPSASYPFGLFSVGPETYPATHTGYEYLAKVFTGFSHTRMEGVGCRGSGGNLLVTPFLDGDSRGLIKVDEHAAPGYYGVSFANGIGVELAAGAHSGAERYRFPSGDGGIRVDLSHTLANRFIAEAHKIEGRALLGWVDAGTTCREGVYRLYYCLILDGTDGWQDLGNHRLEGRLKRQNRLLTLKVGISAVDTAYARAAAGQVTTVGRVRKAATERWEELLGMVETKGSAAERKMFYSLLYRVLQSPFAISEAGGAYRATDGTLQNGGSVVFNGWAVWDNYRTQLPFLALSCPGIYQDIVLSLAQLYRFGKKDWATQHEPSNSVRTEHTAVVLVDAYRKGFRVDFRPIVDSMKKEVDSLDFTHPDKALESSYDTWAMSQVYAILQRDSSRRRYLVKAAEYKDHWKKDFADLSQPDVDRMGARGMYQGTIWQYRWLVPYDLRGLIALCGGEQAYLRQLDAFFARDLYNAANETDIQVPAMYNGTGQAFKSQDLIRRYASDTVVQLYTDVSVRGVDPIIGKVYNNRPDAFLRSMDDDAGAMSAWWLFAAAGLTQPCVGRPVYYLHVSLFSYTRFTSPGFTIEVVNPGARNRYIRRAWLNGKALNRAWITHQEITRGGRLVIEASDKPQPSFGARDRWMTSLDDQ